MSSSSLLLAKALSFLGKSYCCAIVEQNVQIINSLAKLNINNALEFEIRFGLYDEKSKSFHTGVSRDFFISRLQQLDNKNKNKNSNNQNDEYDFSSWKPELIRYYPNQIRSFTDPVDGTESYQMTKKISKTDLIQQKQEEGKVNYDLRLNLKTENSVKKSYIESKNLLYVRYKKKKTFEFVDRGFKIDFSIVWQAKSESSLDESKQVSAYEIEIEILNDQIKNVKPSDFIDFVANLLNNENKDSACSLFALKPNIV